MNNMQLTITSSTTSMDLNDHQTGIYLLPELEGFTGLPEIRTASGVNAGYDGGWTSAQNYDARLIAIRGAIANPDIPTVEALRRKLAALCGQGKTESLKLTLTTEAGNTYTVFVRTISCTMSLPRVLTQQEFLIQFRADDPLIYDEGASGGTEAILQVQRALGGFQINFELPLEIDGGPDATIVDNNGTEYVYPVIVLYGPLHSPTVINRTTNQQMQIIADLAHTITWTEYDTESGEYIQIDNTAGLPAPITDLEIKGKTEQGKLPAGYTQLDYIENTDTSLMTYINTGVQLGTSDFEISAGVYFTATATYESPVLSIWTSTYGYWDLFKTGGNIDCYTQAHNIISGGATVGTWFDYKLTRSGSNWALEDGVHTGITWTYTISQNINNTNLIINARGDLSTGYKTSARYSYVKIKVAGILVRNYVPAKRNSDSKIGFYDIINDTFVSSAGTNEFTAGATVPNPNTPQDIYNVSGENTIHICGKNLFDKNAITSGKILGRDDGTLATQASYGVTDFIEVKPGEKYTFTGFNYWYSCYYDENQTYIDHPTNTATITIPNGVRYIRSSLLLTNLDTAQFERGETASSYEAYQGRDYPLIIDSFDLSDGYVKLEYIQTPTDAFTSNPLYVELTDIWRTTNWKMEFDFAIASNYNFNCIFGRTDNDDTTKEIWIDTSATYKYRAFGIAVVGTNEVIGESVSIGKRYRISHDNLGDKFTVITNGTQTYQYNGKLPATSSAGQTYAFGWRKGGGQFRGKIYGIKTWDGNGLVDDLVPAMRKSDNAIGFYNRVDKSFRTMQGAGASTATAGPRSDFLGKIDDSQDKIYTDGADWYVRKEIDKITFYGASAENWTAGTLTSLRYVVGINVDGKKYSASNSIYGLKSDRNLPNKSSEADALEQNDYTFRGTTYGNRLWYFLPKSEFVGSTAAEIVTEWKTMLATNPATVYYALETPTDTKITNADLIAQLDALKKTKLFQGQNNLATITLNSIPTLELEYGTAYDEFRDAITIDSQARTITMNGVDIYDKKTSASEFLMIAPGENKLVLTSAQTSDEGYAEVKFKQGYISI